MKRNNSVLTVDGCEQQQQKRRRRKRPKLKSGCDWKEELLYRLQTINAFQSNTYNHLLCDEHRDALALLSTDYNDGKDNGQQNTIGSCMQHQYHINYISLPDTL